MPFNELRAVIRIVLTEGLLDDIKAASKRDAKEWDAARKQLEMRMPMKRVPNYIRWLSRIASSTSEPLRDIVPLITDFHDMKERNQLKGPDRDIDRFKTAEDLSTMLQNLPLKTGSESSSKRIKGDIQTVYSSKRFDVLKPLTTEASCWAGKGTPWCTARQRGKNFFLEYTLGGIVLYYVIDRMGNKWSVAANQGSGKIISSTRGGATVDDKNRAYDPKVAFGKEWDDIRSVIEADSKSKHPAKARIESARKNPRELDAMLAAASMSDRAAIMAEVLNHIPYSWEQKTRLERKKHSATYEVLEKWAIRSARKKPSGPWYDYLSREMLIDLFRSKDPLMKGHLFQVALASQPDIGDDILEKLSRSRSVIVRRVVSVRKDLPDSVKKRLSKDKDPWVVAQITKDKSKGFYIV